jgi:hypothetical protein
MGTECSMHVRNEKSTQVNQKTVKIPTLKIVEPMG